MWHDLVLFHLAQPFRTDAVSFAVPFPIMMKTGPLLLVTFIAWAIGNGRRDTAMFAAAYGVAVMLLFSTGKQAFANYHFPIGHAFFLAAAAFSGKSIISRTDGIAEITSARKQEELH